MAEHFRYDFLKLEFRPLYDEIQEEINSEYAPEMQRR